MMLNDRIHSLNALQGALRKAEEHLSGLPADTPYSEFHHRFQELGLEKGWGDCAHRVRETIHLFLDLLEAPDLSTLEKFLGTIPMVFNVVILSPHGYFAQANVLGYPDTGGQVVYILDQVCAMENEMLLRIKQQGLNITPRILIVTRLLPDAHGTTCGQRLEKVLGTEHVCHSEQKMGLFTNGSRDSKAGLTWKHTPMTWHTRLPEGCRPTLT